MYGGPEEQKHIEDLKSNKKSKAKFQKPNQFEEKNIYIYIKLK